MREKFDHLPEKCYVEIAIGVVGGRWKLAIVKILGDNKTRYNQLYRSLPGITQRMMSRQLRELENDGIVSRRVIPDSPPGVVYSLTDMGSELVPIALALEAWGYHYRGQSHPSGTGESSVEQGRISRH